ncbi:LysR family transcriptional regulator [Nonomuraea polychroma]|uniref:LysR family transcriptional regulator n=1 Tax=Nonomuraea polychroma TaxID=46176 RepID=UPI003D8B7F51
MRYFVEVAAQGSIRAAAESLLVAPSAVSRQVRLLERDLGVRLFDRVASGMRLTEAGTVALEHFLASADRDEALRERLRGGTAAVPTLRVGLLEGLVGLASALTTRLDRRSPGTRLDLLMLPSQQVIEHVAGGEVDVGFSSGRHVGKHVQIVATIALPVRLMVGPDHAFAGRESVTMADLVGQPVVLPDATFGIRREVDRACHEHHIAVDLIGETNTLTLALELALARGAATLLTLPALPRDADRRGITAIPIKDKRLASVPLSVVVAHDPPRAAAVRLGAELGKDLLLSPRVRAWT